MNIQIERVITVSTPTIVGPNCVKSKPNIILMIPKFLFIQVHLWVFPRQNETSTTFEPFHNLNRSRQKTVCNNDDYQEPPREPVPG